MDFDPTPYREATRRHNELERRAIERSADAARDEARRIALVIGETDPAVQRVILFGSLATGTPRSLAFDIDLALDGGDVYKAMDVGESTAFTVDLVDLRRLPTHVREGILGRGVELYRRDAGNIHSADG